MPSHPLGDDAGPRNAPDGVDAPALPDASLERCRIRDEQFVFDGQGGLARALADGVFLLDIPGDMDVDEGDRCCRQFYAGPGAAPYGRLRDLGADTFGDPLLGFHRRRNQTEQFLLERRFWQGHFTPGLRALAERLAQLSAALLRSLLGHLDIPAEHWRRATGNCSHLGGSYHLTFNHYLPHHLDLGLNPHKDDSFLTLLRATSPGLEVRRNGRWEAVAPRADCFVVNFGMAMEILTSSTVAPAHAVLHRVARQTQERHTYALFASSTRQPGHDAGIYRYVPGTGLAYVCDSGDLIDQDYANSDTAEGATA